MYGAQTLDYAKFFVVLFENDVEMYGAQTPNKRTIVAKRFENDVEMYGAQTNKLCLVHCVGLRMM